MKHTLLKVGVLLLGVVFLTGCLDDKDYTLDPSGTSNIIQFLDPSVPASPSGAMYPAYATSFKLAPSATYEVSISNAGPKDNKSDVVLTLGVDPSALELYNIQMETGIYGNEPLNGTTYDLMPDNLYDLASTTVTIPAGQKTVTISITVYPELFDFSKNYALPLRIVSASSGILSEHYSVGIFGIGVRNKYDGIYKITGGGIIRHQADAPGYDPVLSGDFVEGLRISLSTTSSTTVTFAPPWKDGSGVGGIDGTYISIDEGTNNITVISNGNATLHNVGVDNKFIPASGTTPQKFLINIEWGSGTGLREIYDMELTYESDRP